MFKSKTRDIVISQAEHAKFSGVLASNWGNSNFDKPAFDFNSFVEGVKYHDIGYGEYDINPLGELNSEQWANLTLKGAKNKFDNPVTDIVAKLHLKRLLDKDDMFREEILSNIEKRVEESLLATIFSIKDFMWADRITDFCDWVSFNFFLKKILKEVLKSFHGKIHHQKQN